MNTKEPTPTANPRTNRIQKFSAVLRTFFRITAVLSAVGGLVNIWWALPVHVPERSGSANAIAIRGVTNLILAVGFWLCGKLFMYYARGELFSPKIVACIRQIGWVGIIKGVVSAISTFVFIHWGPAPPSVGLIIAAPISFLTMLLGIVPGIALICVAWVMDEGRKIQEEQELTV